MAQLSVMRDASNIFATIMPLASSMSTAAVPSDEAEDSGGFMGLPVELRIMIYRLLLLNDGKISFHDYIPLSDWFEGLQHMTNTAKNLFTNLLATNRTIHDEATPILYGENLFGVPFSSARDIFQNLPDQLKRIRHLEIYRGRPVSSSHRSWAFEKLGDLSMLRSLTWSHDMRDFKPHHAAKLLLPCMKAVQKRLDETPDEDRKSATEILHFKSHRRRRRYWLPEPETDAAIHAAADYCEKVKTELRKLLK